MSKPGNLKNAINERQNTVSKFNSVKGPHFLRPCKGIMNNRKTARNYKKGRKKIFETVLCATMHPD